jgi:A/G-specific adenine glycosylase
MLQTDANFIETVWGHYALNGRSLPWRELSSDPKQRFYQVVVSELMLQQTQVARVIPKYLEWMKAFPKIDDAATAPLIDVLKVWQGLGYNRRGKYLHDTLIIIAESGVVTDQKQLSKLPGIGINTAGAITAYAFNYPAIFIETNIRTVYLHHYFFGQSEVKDSMIAEVVGRTLDTKSPREWYWALMDYGSHLKTETKNISRSAHYRPQSKFEGSKRQLRAKILKSLISAPKTEQSLNGRAPR